MIPSASPIVAAFQRAPRADRNQVPPTETASEPDGSARDLAAAPSTTNPESSPPLASDNRRHSIHNVLRLADRIRIVEWMCQETAQNGQEKIASKTIRQFPTLFRSNTKANLIRASRLWKNRDDFITAQGRVQKRGVTSSITRVTSNGHRRVYTKARAGRGRKRAEWVQCMHEDLVSEFDRLRKLGVKFNLKVLRQLARSMVETSEKDAYFSEMKDPASGRKIMDMLTPRWIQSFAERYQIVSRAHTGKLLLSPAKELFIEKEVAYHLGQIAREFWSNSVDENDIGNADETHFLINVDNCRTLGFSGDVSVKYADVVSGGEGITMVVRLSGGRDSKIESPFMVFQNASRSYPIRGVADNVPGVSYRSGPKGWMDTAIMPQWLRERRAITALPHGRKRILYVDNCSGHNSTDALTAALHDINTEIRYFPPNATHLVQPADSFVIQKIKQAWSTRWEAHKMSLIQSNEWKDGSGKLKNPGKRFFLKLAAQAVRDVNMQKDENGLTYARKAMIRTGLALNVNGIWEESQLFPKLQEIIKKHRSHFEGQPPVEMEAGGASGTNPSASS